MRDLNTAILLKNSNLRLTGSRKEILATLQSSVQAMSHSEIEKSLPSHLDRITVYRTLQSFIKKGLIHTVTDPHSRAAKYMYSSPDLPKQHAHFKCRLCNTLICLDTPVFKIKSMGSPKGYKAEFYSLIIEGLCDRCSQL
jgi:Fur family transcriptional regulator, ferric uptake regulator